MASKKPDLAESVKRDQYTGVLARLSDGQFSSLLGVLSGIAKRDELETVKVILAAIDANPKTKDDEFPKDLSLQMMDLARKGMTDRKSYRSIRAWYSAMKQEGVDLIKVVKQKKSELVQDAAKESEKQQQQPPRPRPKPKPEATTAEPKIAIMTTPSTGGQSSDTASVAAEEGKLTVADLIKDLKLPVPVIVDSVADLPDPAVTDEVDSAVMKQADSDEGQVEKAVEPKTVKPDPPKAVEEVAKRLKPRPKPPKPPKPPKEAGKSQGPVDLAAGNGLLSVAHQNIQIYNTKHGDDPDLFIQFAPEAYAVSFESNPSCFEINREGEPEPIYISKRVLVRAWRPRHPMTNPLSDKSLGPIVDFFMDRWVNYDMLLRYVDNMDYTQIVFTARRVWWMVRYNEFLRYSLVKEALVSNGELHFRLVQRWLTHPLVKFVVDQWELVNKK